MKRTTISAALAACTIFAACGSEDIALKYLTGPFFSSSDASAVLIDQFYINGGMDDDYAKTGQFSIYIRDAVSGTDIACASQDSGMSDFNRQDMYYGSLMVPFVPIDGISPTTVARMKLVFVEQDSAGCPKPIDPSDDIVGISKEFAMDSAFGSRIWAENGKAVAALRQTMDDSISIPEMAPATTSQISIDKLEFKTDLVDARYYLIANYVEGSSPQKFCQVDDAALAKISAKNTEYAALAFLIPCIDPAAASVTAWFSLYGETTGDPVLIGETAHVPTGRLIGDTLPFTNNMGFISIRGIVEEPFKIPSIRLADLTGTKISSLDLKSAPTPATVPELWITDSTTGAPIACSGASEGFSGINSASLFDALGARIIAADGIRELFGWEGVKSLIIERTDDLACPYFPAPEAFSILEESGNLSNVHFKAGEVSLVGTKSQLTFSVQ